MLPARVGHLATLGLASGLALEDSFLYRPRAPFLVLVVGDQEPEDLQLHGCGLVWEAGDRRRRRCRTRRCRAASCASSRWLSRTLRRIVGCQDRVLARRTSPRTWRRPIRDPLRVSRIPPRFHGALAAPEMFEPPRIVNASWLAGTGIGSTVGIPAGSPAANRSSGISTIVVATVTIAGVVERLALSGPRRCLVAASRQWPR